jgi:hypothetical protein
MTSFGDLSVAVRPVDRLRNDNSEGIIVYLVRFFHSQWQLRSIVTIQTDKSWLI